MKLTKKHIGQLFDIEGSDGSWCYQLIDVKRDELLFYSFNGRYEIEPRYTADWRPFKPTKHWPKRWAVYGWTCGRRNG